MRSPLEGQRRPEGSASLQMISDGAKRVRRAFPRMGMREGPSSWSRTQEMWILVLPMFPLYLWREGAGHSEGPFPRISQLGILSSGLSEEGFPRQTHPSWGPGGGIGKVSLRSFGGLALPCGPAPSAQPSTFPLSSLPDLGEWGGAAHHPFCLWPLRPGGMGRCVGGSGCLFPGVPCPPKPGAIPFNNGMTGEGGGEITELGGLSHWMQTIQSPYPLYRT